MLNFIPVKIELLLEAPFALALCVIVNVFVAFSKVSTLESVYKITVCVFTGYVWTVSVAATKGWQIQTNLDKRGRASVHAGGILNFKRGIRNI